MKFNPQQSYCGRMKLKKKNQSIILFKRVFKEVIPLFLVMLILKIEKKNMH
jgi:hypothetical protein